MDITLRLKVKGVEIELSKDDAKELRDALNGMIGVPKYVEFERCTRQPYWTWDGLPMYYGTATPHITNNCTTWYDSNGVVLTEDGIRDAVTKGRHTNDG